MTQHEFRETIGVKGAKEVEFYSVYTEAMLDSNSEKNRQLLTLASLVIGLLMGIFDTNELNGFYSFFLWMVSCFFFTTCVITTLIFFPKNTSYLKSVIDDSPKQESLKKHLDIISIVASVTFILGIVTLFYLVVVESKFLVKNNNVSSEKILFYDSETTTSSAPDKK